MRKPFNKKTIEKFEVIKEQYQIEGAMTLRRIYYVLLGKGLQKPGKERYILLSKTLLKAREKGYISWNVIIDKTRRIDQRQTFEDFDEIFDLACETYVKDSMKLYQDKHVEVWIEKDAISNNVARVTWALDIPLIIGKGWVSGSFNKKSADRIIEIQQNNLSVVILYISDFDPEGEHIPKKVREKLTLYGCDPDKLDIRKIALRKKQINQFNLQANIGFKVSIEHKKKAYVKDFIKQYGEVQYEIDAMTNEQLEKILVNELKKLIDFDIPGTSDQECREEVKDWLKEHYTQ